MSGITGECVIKCGKSEQEIGGVCYVLPPFCEKMAPHRVCEKCVEGYHFDQGHCVPNHPDFSVVQKRGRKSESVPSLNLENMPVEMSRSLMEAQSLV